MKFVGIKRNHFSAGQVILNLTVCCNKTAVVFFERLSILASFSHGFSNNCTLIMPDSVTNNCENGAFDQAFEKRNCSCYRNTLYCDRA